jgi:methionine synthase II (cobalamin-independent)
VSKLFPTSLVGSYAQPDWLIDREKLAARFPPRVRANELWRVGSEWLEEAQDDATILAIRDQERAGLDIITNGEMRRESYSNRFATRRASTSTAAPRLTAATPTRSRGRRIRQAPGRLATSGSSRPTPTVRSDGHPDCSRCRERR